MNEIKHHHFTTIGCVLSAQQVNFRSKYVCILITVRCLLSLAIKLLGS